MPAIETIRLVRGPSSPQGTPGRLYAPAYTFDTIEPGAECDDPTHPRIPRGTYLCKAIGTPKYPGHYVLQAVPGRSGIVIHSGNFAGCTEAGYISDTDGCIILGRAATLLNHKKQQQRAVVLSRSTLRGFFEMMGGRDFLLQVIDPEDG